MSAGSGASNLGYSNITPLENVNPSYVNVGSTNNPYHFGSNETQAFGGLRGASNNVDAAQGKVPGVCLFKGGAKKLKRKIKNITKKYKMKVSKKRSGHIKRKIKSKYNITKKTRAYKLNKTKSIKMKRTRKNTKKRNYKLKGGNYSQYQNNMPLTQNYSIGGILSPNQLGLANPPPYSLNTGGCVDNYRHDINRGFSSIGH